MPLVNIETILDKTISYEEYLQRMDLAKYAKYGVCPFCWGYRRTPEPCVQCNKTGEWTDKYIKQQHKEYNTSVIKTNIRLQVVHSMIVKLLKAGHSQKEICFLFNSYQEEFFNDDDSDRR